MFLNQGIQLQPLISLADSKVDRIIVELPVMWFREQTDSSEADEPDQLSRRDLFMPGLVISGLVSLVSACKSRSSRNTRTEPRSVLTPTPSEVSDQDVPTVSPFDEPVSASESLNCTNTVPYADLSVVKETSPLAPQIKLYGDQQSSMVVVALPGYVHTGYLRDIFLLRQNGDVIAQKGISEISDIDQYLHFRPIIFDNIRLGDERRPVLLFGVNCNNCASGAYQKYEFSTDLDFENQFNGRPVYSLTSRSVPSDFYQHQAFADFLPNDDSFDDTSGKFHQVVSDDAKFDAAGGLNDFIITDLMGNIFKGDEWADVMNYPRFICYKLVADQYYVRTFIRVS